MEALGKLKQFDAYPKTLEDFRIKTCGGATGRPRRGRGRGEGGVLELDPGSWTLACRCLREQIRGHSDPRPLSCSDHCQWPSHAATVPVRAAVLPHHGGKGRGLVRGRVLAF